MKSILVAGLPFVILSILLSHIRLINALKLPFIYHQRKLILYANMSEIPFEERFSVYLKNQSLPMPMPISNAEAEYAKFELTKLRAKESFEREAALARETDERRAALARESFERQVALARETDERQAALVMEKIAFEEKLAYRWMMTVILCALILGFSHLNCGRGTITPKFRQQLSSSWKQLKKSSI